MRNLTYQIPPDCAGMTLRNYIRRRLDFSARTLSQLKRVENGLTRNGEPCRANTVLQPGDVLTLSLPEESRDYEAVELPLSVLFENEDYLVVNKVPGMPMHPSPGHDRDSLLNAVAFYDQQAGRACLFRPLYRLDRDTSGAVVIARHRAATSAKLTKTYYAVCQGELDGSGTVDVPIGLAPGSKIKRACGAGDRAVTHWEALARGQGHTLLRLTLETGRTHQIRVHMAYLGHPLAGDDLYGGSRQFLARQALHCVEVYLSSPALGMERAFRAPLPGDMTGAFPWLAGITVKETI